ncbi:MAG: hypothetical protein KDC24_13025, partial [Saprospiraceae bacterium]|nr:hypothetical protein [Saprospiraceae bacterium]
GEYTQGAGAIAMLVKHNPRLLEIHDTFGVGTMGVHDFFKPMRKFEKEDVVREVLELAGIENLDPAKVLKNLPSTFENKGILDDNDSYLHLHKETPVFDGPYSNQTYQARVKEALQHFRSQAESEGILDKTDNVLERWERLIFHLPYAFHAKRIASEIFMLENKNQNAWSKIESEVAMDEPLRSDFESEEAYEKAYHEYLRLITKTPTYKAFVKEKLGKSQKASSDVGNMYACSIFLALLSTLEEDYKENTNLTGKKFGFFGYGSGSKSKVFEATIQENWKEVVGKFGVATKLENRTPVSYNDYEALHRKQRTESILPPHNEFAIERIGDEGVRLGARYYGWKGSRPVTSKSNSSLA